MNDKLKKELQSFQGLWHGGFKNNISNIDNRQLGKVFKYCIPNNIINKTVLEIGCGHGSWTRLMTSAKTIYAIDALSAEYNCFWQCVGLNNTHIKYFQVKDFELSEIPNNSIDFVFSYDVFCHISWSGTCEYIKSLKSKMKSGAIGFIMVADYDKYTSSGGAPQITPLYKTMADEIKDFDGPPCPGRWYWYGKDRFCKLLIDTGFEIIEDDIKLDARNPITHFKKEGD